MLKFFKGLKAAYDAIVSKDPNSIYITTDEGLIYLGDKKIGRSPNYTLNEEFTGFYFYDTDDGQLHKIYQKMVQLPSTAFAAIAALSTPHNISNINKVWVHEGFTIQLTGGATPANAGQSLPLPFQAATLANGITVQVNLTNIVTQSGSIRVDNNYNMIVLRYTCTDR